MLNKSIEDYKKEMLQMYSKSIMAVTPLPQYPTEEGSSGRGNLVVILTTARGAFPVKNGVVEVFENGKGSVLLTLRTDENGHTVAVPLAAPQRILSESPSETGEITYALYDIVASAEGFETIRISSVPVFDGVTSLQTVDMLASSAANSGNGTNLDTQNIYQL